MIPFTIVRKKKNRIPVTKVRNYHQLPTIRLTTWEETRRRKIVWFNRWVFHQANGSSQKKRDNLARSIWNGKLMQKENRRYLAASVISSKLFKWLRNRLVSKLVMNFQSTFTVSLIRKRLGRKLITGLYEKVGRKVLKYQTVGRCSRK